MQNNFKTILQNNLKAIDQLPNTVILILSRPELFYKIEY